MELLLLIAVAGGVKPKGNEALSFAMDQRTTQRLVRVHWMVEEQDQRELLSN